MLPRVNIEANKEKYKGLASREVALALLLRVLKQRQTMDQALLAEQRVMGALSSPDRAFAHHLAMAVLRHRGLCEALLRPYLSTPLKPSRLDITCCLHLGICQLLVLHTPPHAAVDASVELAKTCHAPLAGLVNAVLKKIALEGAGWWESIAKGKTNTPDWLWQSWATAYGEEKAEAIAQMHLQEPPLDITVKNAAEITQWQEALGAELLPTGSLRLREGSRDVTKLPGFTEGSWWVQETAASLPVKMMGDLAGKTVLDLCAAPGGKTMQLAAAGAKVTAVDSSASRLKRLNENLDRTRLRAEIIEADIRKWKPDRKFDAILLDAPCSATGTIRRHPEILWLRSQEETERLGNTQRKMIERAQNWLNPGGILVYAVCSLQPEEGENHQLGGEAQRTLPCDMPEQGGMDGFFIARLQN